MKNREKKNRTTEDLRGDSNIAIALPYWAL